ncbi:hypothetical protein E2C01_032308 [Portunus trituberculatus]|uniref:Uncharacterized protein n=1 Tax=Portunus trituberculatus TaxID=210409 RepID=A0A5B7EX57_PORTR|nr:hypothetical protein [Portunus trituberculatus]
MFESTSLSAPVLPAKGAIGMAKAYDLRIYPAQVLLSPQSINQIGMDKAYDLRIYPAQVLISPQSINQVGIGKVSEPGIPRHRCLISDPCVMT